MKQSIYTLFCMFVAVLTAQAQPRAEFSAQTHNMGEVMWHVAGVATFNVSNAGNEDLLITDVRTDCGCTAVSWPEAPIRPGATAQITVSYDAEMLGRFSKLVAVTTNADTTPTYLRIDGRVVMQMTDYSKDFPFQVDDIYLSTDDVEFDDVNRGDMPQKTILVLNASKKNYTPQLMHLPKYITAEAEPKVLRPGRVGRLTLTLNSLELRDMGLNQTEVYVARFPGDRVSKEHQITLSATLLPQFAMTERELQLAPVAQIDTMIDLGALGTKKKVKGQLTLTNNGRTPLQISALQVYNPGITVSLGKRRLNPGESTPLKITVSATSHYFRGRRRILLITNDPNHAKIAIDVFVSK